MDNQERILQYRFTKYLMKSIETYKPKYIRKKELRQQIETLVGDFNEILPERPGNDTGDGLDLQNAAFEKALEKIKARDIQILMLRLLEEYSLKEISELLGIKYKTVITIFNRTIKKIKNEMGEDNHEF